MNNKLNHKVLFRANKLPWLIFLHGAGGNISTWKYQVDSFKERFNLLLLDLRDHGSSKNIEPAFSSYNFDIITDDILKIVEEYKIKKAHFVSLSFGSVLLQALSIKKPNLVLSAVFAGGIFRPNISIKVFVHLARLFNVFLPYKLMYSIFSYLLMPLKRHQYSRKVYKKQAEKLSYREYMKWVGLYHEFFKLLENFYNQKIHYPSLIIMGKEDYVFIKSAVKFSQKHTNVSISFLNNAGHICNIDQPQAFNMKALSFLLDITKTSSQTKQNFSSAY